MSRADFAEDVWSDMLRLYADSRISTLCLALQDEYETDVPLLLFLVLADRSGLACDDAALGAFLDGAVEWRDAVIRPLRTIRREMKTLFDGPDELALRDDIKQSELRAEKLHVARLVRCFPQTGGGMGRLAERYLADRQVSPERRTDCLAVFAEAAAELDGRGLSPSHQHQPPIAAMQ